MRVNNENLLIIDGAAAPTDMSMTINFKPVWLGHIVNYSIQIFFTGTPIGTFKLQISNDVGNISATQDADKYSGVTNWTDVADSSIAVNGAGNIAYEVQDTGAEWVRVVYTPTSSTGTVVSCRAKVKGI